MTARWMLARDRLDWICGSEPDVKALRVRVIAELQKAVGFDAYAWLLTDPDTCVGAAPLAHVPNLADLPRLIRLKYVTDINRWTGLPPDRVVTLVRATEGDPARSRLWRELLHAYAVVDVASMVFRDSYGCWGFLDLWRMGPDGGRFSTDEQVFLTSLIPQLSTALRVGVAATLHRSGENEPTGGAVVLMLSADLDLLAQTPHTEGYLRTLLPPDGGVSPIPAAAYNVAAQLLALEQGIDPHPPTARVHLTAGRWLTLRAARLPTHGSDRQAEPGASPIAVSIEATTPTDRAAVFAAASGLSARETELLQHLLSGVDTHQLAQRMVLSEHTVQDHLKSIFVKTGTRTRPALIARALGT